MLPGVVARSVEVSTDRERLFSTNITTVKKKFVSAKETRMFNIIHTKLQGKVIAYSDKIYRSEVELWVLELEAEVETKRVSGTIVTITMVTMVTIVTVTMVRNGYCYNGATSDKLIFDRVVFLWNRPVGPAQKRVIESFLFP